MHQSPLRNFVEIRKSLINDSIEDQTISGNLTLNQALIQNITQLNELAGVVTSIRSESDTSISVDDLKSGDSVKIELDLPSSKLIRDSYFETFKSYFSTHWRKRYSQEYYIHEYSYYSTDTSSSQDTCILQLDSVHDLIELLYSLQDINMDDDEPRFLFISEFGNLEISVDYSLNNLSLIKLSELETFLSTESFDFEIRKVIFKNELYQFLFKRKVRDRFAVLATDIEDFIRYLKNSYKLHQKGYSYLEFQHKLETLKIEYATNLNSQFTDIQNKLVFIPIAYVLLLLQFDISGVKLFDNIGLTVCAFVFAFLIELLIQNQEASAKVIKNQIETTKSRYDHMELQEKEDVFDTLKQASADQQIRFNLIRLVSWSILVIALSLLAYTNSTIVSSLFYSILH